MANEDSLRKLMLDRIEREMHRAIFGEATTTATTNVATSDGALDARKILEDCDKAIRTARRTQITFIVDRCHQGAIIKHETPNDGTRVEMSWHQANALHQHWPLKLWKVLSEDAAEFVPVSGVFPEFAPKILPMPPFEVPPEENFKDWMAGKYD